MLRYRDIVSRIVLLFVAFLSLTTFALASSPASFCKCTCFSNSTIIPLDPAKPDTTALANLFHILSRSDFTDDHDNTNERRANKYRSLSCNDCNRKFCLDYDLPTCKDAKEEDVFTTCFRTTYPACLATCADQPFGYAERDSRKDEAIVFIFIIATSGLLAWAVFKPWVQKYLEAARERRSYIPVSENADR